MRKVCKRDWKTITFNEAYKFYIELNLSITNCAKELETSPTSFRRVLQKFNISKPHSAVYESYKSELYNKYGVINVFQREDVKIKCRETKEKLYNNPTFTNPEKARNTCIEKYNVSNAAKFNEYKEKSKRTCLERYGSEYYFQSKQYKDWYSRNKSWIKDKEFSTKAAKGSSITSAQEDEWYNKLVNVYGEGDIIRQYKDKRYPFHCDFYIISEDRFIEINYFWLHGNHLFNRENEEDLNTLNYWIDKSKDSEFYKNAIYVWTILDIKKFNTAVKNNLNFISIYYDNYIMLERQ